MPKLTWGSALEAVRGINVNSVVARVVTGEKSEKSRVDVLVASTDRATYVTAKLSRSDIPGTVKLLPDCFKGAVPRYDTGKRTGGCFTIQPDVDLKIVAEQLWSLRSFFELEPVFVVVNGLEVEIPPTAETEQAIASLLTAVLKERWQSDRSKLLGLLNELTTAVVLSSDEPPPGSQWVTFPDLGISHGSTFVLSGDNSEHLLGIVLTRLRRLD